MQCIVDHLLRTLDKAVTIGILNTNNEFAIMLFGKGVIEECHIGGTDVRDACGRRSNSGTDFLHEGIIAQDAYFGLCILEAYANAATSQASHAQPGGRRRSPSHRHWPAS